MSSSPLRSVSTVFCGSCRRLAPWENATQLIPSLHTICIPCVEKQLQKSQICPVMHCYSPIAQPPDQKWSTCQNEGCQRKLSFAADIVTAVCLHELCGKCFDDAYKSYVSPPDPTTAAKYEQSQGNAPRQTKKCHPAEFPKLDLESGTGILSVRSL